MTKVILTAAALVAAAILGAGAIVAIAVSHSHVVEPSATCTAGSAYACATPNK